MAEKDFHTEAITPGIGRAVTVSNVIEELWDRVSDQLTSKELKWFAAAGDAAEHMAFQLEEVVENIGCLVADDKRVGSFQSSSGLPPLLFAISHAINSIRGMIAIGDAAHYRLVNPEQYQARSRQLSENLAHKQAGEHRGGEHAH